MEEAIESFDSLRGRIRERYDDLSPHLQELAKLALDDPNFLALERIATIAARAGTQPSTLIRFAKQFGYDGFSAMQQVFKLRLIEGSPGVREVAYRAGAGQKSQPGDRLDRCADTMIASLEQLKATTPREDIDAAVEMLHRAETILVAGLRRSRPIAAYFSYALLRCELRCSLLDFDGGMAAQQVANMKKSDVLVAVAFPEYSPAVVDIVRDASLRAIPVLTMTDGPSSPLALNATLSFTVDNVAGGAFRPIAGAIALTQTIAEALATKSVVRGPR